MEALEELKYDTVILGTDTTLSILSAALARAGMKVLHLDGNEYYGGADASITLPEFLSFISAGDQPPFEHKELLVAPPSSSDFQSIGRKFVIDLQPRLQYGSGPTVEVMVQGGVSQYLEFKPVTTGVMWIGDRFQLIPSDHMDVMSDERLTTSEKASLLQLVDQVSKMSEDSGLFQPLLQSHNLSPLLQDIIIYGLLLHSEPCETLTVRDAAERMKKHVASLGLYRKDSAMLYPLFGSSDISQAFCRMAAVYGATFVVSPELRLSTAAPAEGGRISMQTSLGQLDCSRLVCSPKYHHIDAGSSLAVQKQYLRLVAITTEVLHPSDVPVILSVPSGSLSPVSVFVLQVTSATSCVPQGFVLYYAWTRISDYSQSRSALEQVSALFPGQVVMKAVYTQNVLSVTAASPVIHVNDVFESVDLDTHIATARTLFESLCPGQPFLPARSAEVAEEDAMREA